jgi:nitrogen regulatory protein PII
VTEVRGFGRQFGQLAAGTGLSRVTLLHKIRLDLVALDDDVETLVEAIAKHARTETIGDGKIWVTPVDGALRVRTGERDRAAI